MSHRFTLEYWPDGDWLVGRLREVPSVFSQGATVEELEENIREVYALLVADERPEPPAVVRTREMEVEV